MAFKSPNLGTRFVSCFRGIWRARSTAPILEESTKTTIDENEVQNMAKLGSQWWDLNGDLRGLHSMNKLRVQLVRDSLCYRKTKTIDADAKPLSGLKIIDVGCGGGILSEALARIGAEVSGLDASNDLIEVARKHAENQDDIAGNIRYICGTVEDHAKENPEFYDAIVASEVLEHVNEKECFLEACTKLIKPGGSIFITTLNKTMASWLGGVIAAEYLLRILPRGTHDWDKFIAPHEVQYMLEKNGCYTKLVHGMFYNFLCNEWLWTSNLDISYAMHAVKEQ